MGWSSYFYPNLYVNLGNKIAQENTTTTGIERTKILSQVFVPESPWTFFLSTELLPGT